jgi:hypothetical protein
MIGRSKVLLLDVHLLTIALKALTQCWRGASQNVSNTKLVSAAFLAYFIL